MRNSTIFGKVIQYANNLMGEEEMLATPIDHVTEKAIPEASIDNQIKETIAPHPIPRETSFNIFLEHDEDKLKHSNNILKKEITSLINREFGYLKNDEIISKIDQLNTNIGILSDIDNLSSNFIQKYPDLNIQKKFFELILNKIELHDQSLLKLKMESSFYLAKIIISLSKEPNQFKLTNYKIAVQYLEQANEIKITQNFDTKFDIRSTIKYIIQSYPDDQEAFTIAQHSLSLRNDYFKGDHSEILEGLITAAKAGYTIKDKVSKIVALKYANDAYNMAMRIDDFNSAEYALEYMSEIYKSFKNIKLGGRLMTESNYLCAKQNSQNNDKVLNVEIIVKKGEIDPTILAIREKIQEAILDKITQAAADGKWFKLEYGLEYGVCGYLDEYLKKQLGEELSTPSNFEIALMLCFEAINLGIMSSTNRIPYAAIIFTEKYSTIVEKIIDKHPEYFVDGYIARLIIGDKSTLASLLEPKAIIDDKFYLYQEKILTQLMVGDYSPAEIAQKPLEKLELTSFVKQVLIPVKELIAAGKWDNNIKNDLISYASDEYLTKPIISFMSNTCIIGYNLGEINDATNIARILIFGTIVATLKETKSVSYESVKAFMTAYRDLASRILDDHPEYVENRSIKNICENSAAHIETVAESALDQTILFIGNEEETKNIFHDIIESYEKNLDETDIAGKAPIEST